MKYKKKELLHLIHVDAKFSYAFKEKIKKITKEKSISSYKVESCTLWLGESLSHMLVGSRAREGFLKVYLIRVVTIIIRHWTQSDDVGPLLSLNTTSSLKYSDSAVISPVTSRVKMSLLAHALTTEMSTHVVGVYHSTPFFVS